MAQSDIRPARTSAQAEGTRAPSVLVVLVCKDGAAWVRQSLLSLSCQTHPRLSILAVDNASVDGSADILESALGAERVIRLDRNVGFSGAVQEGLKAAAPADADYLLLLHDDVALEPGAIGALVEAAAHVDGVGVVGPKVLDWDDPIRLRDVGMSTDRFGHPYSPLEDGEIDQGQYDRIREVMYVSSCAMLVPQGVLSRVGPPDERFPSRHEDVDFCWRVRMAGFRVLMTPKAVAHHRNATVMQERADAPARRRDRYLQERAALASMLKNYSVPSLLWILPLYAVTGLGRLAFLAATRRFEDAYQMLRAWGWNLMHLPSTIGRRVRAQSVRSVPDRKVRRAMAPAGIRLRRWGSVASRALLPPRRVDEDEVRAPGWVRAARFAATHPVLAAWSAATVTALFAYRHIAGASPFLGGQLTAFPAGPSGFFRELVSGLQHTALGGTNPASPALGFLGLGSAAMFGSPPLLQKALVLVLPAGAAVGAFRAIRRLTSDRVSSTAAAACYAFSSLVLWALSEGSIPVLVFLAGLPWLAMKLHRSFWADIGVRPLRWVVGAGMGLAVLGSFFPGVSLAAAVLVLSTLAFPATAARRARALALTAAAALAAVILMFPVGGELLSSGASGVATPTGRPSFVSLLHGSMGPAPGSWFIGLYLPLGAAIALVFVSARFARFAVRAAAAAIPSVYLAWLSAAGYLPKFLSNAPAYAGVATFSFVVLIGLGLASILPGLSRASFGIRQLGGAALTVVVGVGLIGQAAQAGKGSWTVGGPERVPAAYPLVQGSPGLESRILWLGRAVSADFPAPAGPAQGVVASGPASVRFAVTGSGGGSALDVGRPSEGPGFDYLGRALTEILAGRTRHGGALLAPLGVRFIVAGTSDLPADALVQLRGQLDLDELSVAEGGLRIFRNARAVPVAAAVFSPDWRRAAASPGTDLDLLGALSTPDAAPLHPAGDTFRKVSADTGMVLLSQQFDSHWNLYRVDRRPVAAVPIAPKKAFGWAVRFDVTGADGLVEARFDGQMIRTVEISLLALLWLGALWITRRPVHRG